MDFWSFFRFFGRSQVPTSTAIPLDAQTGRSRERRAFWGPVYTSYLLLVLVRPGAPIVASERSVRSDARSPNYPNYSSFLFLHTIWLLYFLGGMCEIVSPSLINVPNLTVE